jgi:ligand-binding sensor domain-containing protein/signal transduction histidine kinase
MQSPRSETYRLFLLTALMLFTNVSSALAAALETTVDDSSQDNAAIIEMDAPSTVVTGEVFTATITLRNTGKTDWKKAGEHSYHLGSQNRVENTFWCGTSRIDLPERVVIHGETVTFRLTCRAPSAPGVYPFAWRMVHEWVNWFGERSFKMIEVISQPQLRPSFFQYSVRSWAVEQGLPQNTVQAITQTSDGYLWIGTPAGLAQFDGVRFKVFNNENTPELKVPVITALCAQQDDLWIGTFNGGLLRRHDGVFQLFTTADGLPANSIRCLLAARDGSVWIGTTNGLGRFKAQKFKAFTVADGLSQNWVRSLCEDRDGTLYIGTPGELKIFKNDRIKRLTTKEAWAPGTPRSLQFDPGGNLLISGLGGMSLLTSGGDILEFTREEGLLDNNVLSSLCDSRGNLWVGAYGGLCRYAAGKWRPEMIGENTPFDAVFSLIEDRERNVWVGTKDGLYCLDHRPFTSYSRQQNLSHINAISVREDRAGAIWIATWGGGLNQLKDGEVTVYDTTKGLPLNQTLSLCDDHEGDLWAGLDFEGGLARFSRGKWNIFNKNDGLQGSAIRVTYEDRKQNLWLGTSDALVLFSNGQFSRFTTRDGLAGNTVRAILEDESGDLWIGTNDGLSRRKNGAFSNFTTTNGLPKNTILALYEDVAHDLWIGTQGGGLCRYRRGKFTIYNRARGLHSDDIHEVLEDDFGYLWMTSRTGIFRVFKKNLDELDAGTISTIHCDVYGKTDGLVSIECSAVGKPGAWKARDGRLWFATAKGVSVVDPKLIPERNSSPVRVVIEEVIADKQMVAARPEMERGKTVIPPGRGELEFHYTALSFTAPEKNRFKFKLEGSDPDWVDAVNRRVAYYNNLKPGDYSFKVIACNHDGVWNAAGAQMKFTLQPHFWQTWGFKGFIVVLGASLVGASARYATKRRMQLRLERLEQQHAIEKERTRIAQDMHDDLGARLSEIVLLSELTHRREAKPEQVHAMTGKISAAARDLVDNLDAIVWAVNPKNDSLNKFVQYLSECIPMYLEPAAIRCLFDVPSKLMDCPLSSEVRHNLFLVVKEALHNVVKHAQASEVRISLCVQNETLCLRLEDNGKAFPSQNDSAFGNGLLNMKDRVHRIGGQLNLESTPGKGTGILIRIPIKRINAPC